MIQPKTVYLHLTQQCNLKCKYCYISAGNKNQDELTTQELLELIEEIYLLEPEKVVFTGGEPLLHEDLIILAQTLKNKPENKSKLSIVTNGTRINENNISYLVNCFDKICISIDGLKNVNDKLRGEGTFDKIMNAFRIIIENGGNAEAFITITSMNIDSIKDFMSYLICNGISTIHFSQLHLLGRAKHQNKLLSNYDMAMKFISEFWSDQFGLELKKKQDESLNCGVGKYLNIMPDGNVFPCHVLAYPEFLICNVKQKKLHEVYSHSKIIRKLRNLDFIELEKENNFSTNPSISKRCLGDLIHRSKFKEIVG